MRGQSDEVFASASVEGTASTSDNQSHLTGCAAATFEFKDSPSSNKSDYVVPEENKFLWKTFERGSAVGRCLSALYSAPPSRLPLRTLGHLYPLPKPRRGGRPAQNETSQHRQAKIAIPKPIRRTSTTQTNNPRVEAWKRLPKRKPLTAILTETKHYGVGTLLRRKFNEKVNNGAKECFGLYDFHENRKAELQHAFAYQCCSSIPGGPATASQTIPLGPSALRRKYIDRIQKREQNGEEVYITRARSEEFKGTNQMYDQLLREICEYRNELERIRDCLPTVQSITDAVASAMANQPLNANSVNKNHIRKNNNAFDRTSVRSSQQVGINMDATLESSGIDTINHTTIKTKYPQKKELETLLNREIEVGQKLKQKLNDLKLLDDLKRS